MPGPVWIPPLQPETDFTEAAGDQTWLTYIYPDGEYLCEFPLLLFSFKIAVLVFPFILAPVQSSICLLQNFSVTELFPSGKTDPHAA